MANASFDCRRADAEAEPRPALWPTRRESRERENPVGNATCATERFAQVDFPADCVAESAPRGRGRGNPVGNATCATEGFAQVDFPADCVPEICTGRYSDRFFARGTSRGPLFRRIGPPRLAQVDIPADSGAATCTGRYSDRFFAGGRRAGPLSAGSGPARAARVDISYDSGTGRQSSCDYEASWGA